MTGRPLRSLISVSVLALAAFPAFAGPLLVTGIATAEDPTAPVTVELLPRTPRYVAAIARLAGDDAPAALASARPRLDGTFSLTVPEPGMWTLRVTAPGHVSHALALEPLVADRATPAVVLPAAPSRELRVTDGAERPLAGVLVTAWSAATQAAGEAEAWHPAVAHRWSDPAGRVVLPPLAADARLRLEHPAFPDLALGLVDAGPVATAALTAVTARELRVLGPTGDPEPGVLVFVGPSWLPSGTSDAEGRLTVATPAGESELVLLAADGRRATIALGPASREDAADVLELHLPAAESVAGRVVDAESREPVADAIVWPTDEPGDATMSGPRGDFRLTVGPPGEADRVLHVAAAGHFPTQVSLESPGSPALGAITVALAPAAAVSGRVVDPEGRAVTGASVRVGIDPGRAWAGLQYGLPATTSGARGTFHLPLLRPNVAYVLSAHHVGFGAARERIVAGAGGDEVVLRLELGRRATGRLLDLQERPIADGEVRLHPQSSDRRSRFRDDDGGHLAHSDAEGRFEVADLTAGTYDLEAEADGFAPLAVPGVVVAEAPATELGDLLLAAGAEIVGRVVDAAGEPVAEAAIYLQSRGSLPLRDLHRATEPETHSAPDGSFRIVDRQPGESLGLAARREGYAMATAPAVVAGEAEAVEMVLRPLGTLRGRVVDEQGRAVAGAGVLARPSSDLPRRSGEKPTPTAADGSFTLAAVEPGAAAIEATAPGFQPAILDPVEVPAGGEVSGLELVLEPAATVAGVVRTEDGEPVPRATVLSGEPNPTIFPFQGVRRSRHSFAQTAADGTFSLDGLRPGAQRLVARHPGLGEAVRDVDLALGRNRVDLVLVSGHEISGRVVDGTGSPVAGAVLETRVIADHGARYGQPRVARSDGDGTFRLTGVADGRYELSARAAGQGRSSLEIEVAGADVGGLRIELAPGATIRGRIQGLELDELASTQVAAHAMTEALGGVVDHRGELEIVGVAAGQWLVIATTRDGRTRTAQIEVPPGAAEAGVDLDFAGGLTLSGRVLRDGVPVARMEVTVHDSAGRRSSSGSTDREGRFRLRGLAAGSYVLSTRDPNSGRTFSETVEIVEDLEHDLVFATSMVSGRVVDAVSGAAIPRAVVSMSPAAGDFSAATIAASSFAESDSRGHFEVTSFTAGSHRLTVTADGYALEEIALDLAADSDQKDLLVTLDAGLGIELQVVARGMPRPERIAVGVLAADGRLVTSGSHTVDARGMVRLAGLPPGTWTLYVAVEDSAPVTVSVEVPGPAVTVVLEPAAVPAARPEIDR